MWYNVETNERFNDEEMLALIRDYIDDTDFSDIVDDLLNESYPLIRIGTLTLAPSEVLKECSYRDYEDYINDYDEDLYNEIEYYFNHTEKENGEVLSHFIENTLSGEIVEKYEWREE